MSNVRVVLPRNVSNMKLTFETKLRKTRPIVKAINICVSQNEYIFDITLYTMYNAE